MEEISLLQLWDGIRKRLPMIIVLTLVVGLGSFLINYFVLPPKYEASTTMLISKPKDYNPQGADQINYDDILVNQKLVSTYSEIIRSRGIAKQVIDNLELDFDLADFEDRVSVQTVKDTEVISVKVVDTIPERAMDIANETSEIFRDSIKGIMSIDNVNILDAAELPTVPVSPRVLLNTVLGLLLGLMLGVFLAVIRETTDTTIKTTDEITKEFNLTVLGVIPQFKNGGN